MFLGIEPFYCVIYRLQDSINYDFSASEEGEVDEQWGVVSFGTPCRYNFGTTNIRRRTDGLVETGRRQFFVEDDVDIRVGDRIIANGYFYKVSEAEPIYDIYNTLHHYECVIELIDWKLPEYPTQWVDPDGETNTEIKEVPFEYNSTSPVYMITLNIGDTIGKVAILIEEAFDNSNATLTIGKSTDTDLLMSSSDNLPSIVNYYEIVSSHESTVEEIINLYIAPLTSTTGSGRAFIEVIRAT